MAVTSKFMVIIAVPIQPSNDHGKPRQNADKSQERRKLSSEGIFSYHS